MIIIIEIKDELITRWGSIFINDPNYDTTKTHFFIPGFEYKTPAGATAGTTESTFKFRILTDKDIAQMAAKNMAAAAQKLNTGEPGQKKSAKDQDPPQPEKATGPGKPEATKETVKPTDKKEKPKNEPENK